MTVRQNVLVVMIAHKSVRMIFNNMKTTRYKNSQYIIPDEFHQYRLFDRSSGRCLDFWSDKIEEAVLFSSSQPNELELSVLVNNQWIKVGKE